MYINKEQRWGGAGDVQVSSKTDLRIHKTKGWGGVGWGGADNVQIRNKTDSRIHKTKGWGGVGWGGDDNMQQVASASHTQRVHRRYVEMRHTFPTVSYKNRTWFHLHIAFSFYTVYLLAAPVSSRTMKYMQHVQS